MLSEIDPISDSEIHMGTSQNQGPIFGSSKYEVP